MEINFQDEQDPMAGLLEHCPRSRYRCAQISRVKITDGA